MIAIFYSNRHAKALKAKIYNFKYPWKKSFILFAEKAVTIKNHCTIIIDHLAFSLSFVLPNSTLLSLYLPNSSLSLFSAQS